MGLTFTVHMGTPTTYWCDTCMTSGGIDVTGYAIDENGSRPCIRIRRCTTCFENREGDA